MSLITFLEKLLPFLFKAAKREWDSLPAAEQDALKHGSGITAILNQEIGKLPADTRALILKTYPDLNEAALEAGLFAVAHAFNLAPKENDLEDCIAVLQTYLSTRTGKVWDAIMQSVANIITIAIAPTATLTAKIFMLMQFVYERFIKK